MNGQAPRDTRRIDSLWFAPETVVIRAEDVEYTAEFKVSRAVLAARSTVFRDMFAFPQPSANEAEFVDGSPVVRLHDSAADVQAFLQAIFDSSYFMPAPEPIELPIILGILRLSHKYDVQYLYRRSLGHLIADGWYTTTPDQIVRSHIPTPPTASEVIDNAFALIAAANEVGARWLLPRAYYIASGYSSHLLLPHLHGSMREYAQICLAAHPHLVRGTIAVNRFIALNRLCETGDICAYTREELLLDLLNQVSEQMDLDPLGEWSTRRWEQLLTASEGLCESCLTYARSLHKIHLYTFWEKLPSIFGLSPWTELHAMKRGAMGEDEDGAAN
ncbi:hypothetical protein B0H19DRAFT_1184106 [Mycena capillaripes]|nr:hypothetical protein B0H19DRAFT_1184106 [Mycena capillaripes]